MDRKESHLLIETVMLDDLFCLELLAKKTCQSLLHKKGNGNDCQVQFAHDHEASIITRFSCHTQKSKK